MKSILTFLSIIVLALVLTIGVFAAESETPKVIQPGDVNADGVIDTKDAVLLAQYLAKWDVQLGGDSHTVVIDEAVEPTCKTTGLTEGKHCSDCGMILVKQRIIPTTDHDFEETFVNPTTNSDGYTLCKCTVCGHEEKKNFVPAVNSNGLEIEVDTTNKTCVITGIGTCEDTDINIPEKISEYTVVGIADKAFSEQTQITSVTIPKTVKSLGQRAFYGCTGLTEFTIPESVTFVGHQIFYKCDNLTTVYYNSSFSPAQDKVFLNIDSIKTVIFGGTTIPSNILYTCLNVETIKVAKSIKSSNYYAFYGCSNLKNLYITDIAVWIKVYQNYVGSSSYPSCSNIYVNNELLTELVIPESVTTVSQYPFYNCDSIEKVIVHDKVTSISFSNCDKLAEINIPKSVKSISFYNCDALKNIDIPDSVTSIYFYSCSSLTSVTIPDSVTSIGGSAFYNCSSLTSVTIPDSVTSIGGSAFYNCSSLTSVTIPDSVMSIGGSAFYNCSSLTSVTIGDSVTSIGDWAFKYCSSLTSVTIPDSVTSIGGSAFYNCSSLTSVTIPDSVTSIGGSAFYNCSSLTSVTIPDSVTSIGFQAFNGCSSLTSVTIPDSVTSIDYEAFRGCTSLTSVTIPDSVTSIGSYAFYNCSGLTSVTIPDSVTSIGDYAFYDCSSLNTVYYGGNASDWSGISFGYRVWWNTPKTIYYYYSETEPTSSGNYWHYVDGKPTPW